MISETIVEIQKLLDEHSPIEQAQARVFVESRYPSLSEINRRGKHWGNDPLFAPGHAPPFAPNDPPGQNGANDGANDGAMTQLLRKYWSSSFLVFWSEYPKKKGKQEALQIWKKLKPDQALTDRILQSVREQKTSEDWVKEGGQFIPYPKTFLRQMRWEDEPTQLGSRRGATLSEKTRGNADVARAFVERMNGS